MPTRAPRPELQTLKRYCVFSLVENTDRCHDEYLAKNFIECPLTSLQEIATKLTHCESFKNKRLKSVERRVSYPYVDATFFSSYQNAKVVASIIEPDDCVNLYDSQIKLEKGCYEEVQMVDPKKDMIETPIDEENPMGLYGNPDDYAGDDPNKKLTPDKEKGIKGYIIIAYKIMYDNQDLDFVSSWKTWTGVRYICMQLPRQLGLRRIAFYREMTNTSAFKYVLVIEISNLLKYAAQTLNLVDRLKLRLCGYVGVYRQLEFDLDALCSQAVETDQRLLSSRPSGPPPPAPSMPPPIDDIDFSLAPDVDTGPPMQTLARIDRLDDIEGIASRDLKPKTESQAEEIKQEQTKSSRQKSKTRAAAPTASIEDEEMAQIMTSSHDNSDIVNTEEAVPPLQHAGGKRFSWIFGGLTSRKMSKPIFLSSQESDDEIPLARPNHRKEAQALVHEISEESLDNQKTIGKISTQGTIESIPETIEPDNTVVANLTESNDQSLIKSHEPEKPYDYFNPTPAPSFERIAGRGRITKGISFDRRTSNQSETFSLRNMQKRQDSEQWNILPPHYTVSESPAVAARHSYMQSRMESMDKSPQEFLSMSQDRSSNMKGPMITPATLSMQTHRTLPPEPQSNKMDDGSTRKLKITVVPVTDGSYTNPTQSIRNADGNKIEDRTGGSASNIKGTAKKKDRKATEPEKMTHAKDRLQSGISAQQTKRNMPPENVFDLKSLPAASSRPKTEDRSLVGKEQAHKQQKQRQARKLPEPPKVQKNGT